MNKWMPTIYVNLLASRLLDLKWWSWLGIFLGLQWVEEWRGHKWSQNKFYPFFVGCKVGSNGACFLHVAFYPNWALFLQLSLNSQNLETLKMKCILGKTLDEIDHQPKLWGWKVYFFQSQNMYLSISIIQSSNWVN